MRVIVEDVTTSRIFAGSAALAAMAAAGVAWLLIRLAMLSRARLAIASMPDLLALDSRARINTSEYSSGARAASRRNARRRAWIDLSGQPTASRAITAR